MGKRVCAAFSLGVFSDHCSAGPSPSIIPFFAIIAGTHERPAFSQDWLEQMASSEIVVRGAREHNLRAVNLHLPRNRLICFTGVSGSGKSSLAFDTLYAEGQRRYIESLSSHARHFFGQMPKPDVELITGLSPAISISQKTGGQNPRSTVGTVTEIFDFLRVLYARAGDGHCPSCGRPITSQTREQIIGQIVALPRGTAAVILAPVARGQRGEFRELLADLARQGFTRARIDGRIVRIDEPVPLDRHMRHDIEVVVDRLILHDDVRGRLIEAVETALRLGNGELIVAVGDDSDRGETGRSGAAKPADMRFSAHYSCTHCQVSFDPPSPQLFSFNSPRGMCSACQGLGELNQFDLRLLIPDPSRSIQQGCIALMGSWRDIGRMARCRFRGVAAYLEKLYGLPAGSVLETAWEELDPRCQQALLYGTGDAHITFTWRSGPLGKKFGGQFEGIIPGLLQSYHLYRGTLREAYFEPYMSLLPCPECGGSRLNRQAMAVTLTTASPKFADKPARSLPEVCALPVSDAIEFFRQLELTPLKEAIAGELLKEVRGRLGFLADVGLDYLSLDRAAPTLSGGEMQRIRLAGQVGCGLCGVLYILDEPSIGLHPRDNVRLLNTLTRLRDQGNTVVVVEHDEDTMRTADHIVDFGPGPGVRGGNVVAAGPLSKVMETQESVTGQFLCGRRAIRVPQQRRPAGAARLIVREATHNNLRGIDVEFPLGLFVCVTGVSGSGKSSLVRDILAEALNRELNGGAGRPGAHRAIEGLEHLDKMIDIDQSPIGRTPRSNPATYIKLFDHIRSLFCSLPEAKARGFQAGRFSFNVAGGRCEACEGHGAVKLDMDFLADIWVQCAACGGRRFNHETLQVRFKGKSIADVLDMDVQEALKHFENIPRIERMLQTLHDVGLDYLKLGQASPTLSGGEAQRIKLARELVKRSTGRTLYLLDEPTTGLHFADIEMLLKVLHGFVETGNTVIVVEHNLEVIKTADWIIDLGPEGGSGGGLVVACGTPEEVARCEHSHTGQALRSVLEGDHGRIPAAGVSHDASHDASDGDRSREPAIGANATNAIVVRGAHQHNLKHVDAVIPRDRMTVCCGPSGSGKTSLAMDTIYAEGQRRYVESLSAYARQFVGQMPKPLVEHIEGLSPAVAIEQKHLGHSPRSTVGTITEVYDYLRIVFARLGQAYCPDCNVPIASQTTDEIVAKLLARPEGTALHLLAPIVLGPGESYRAKWEELRAAGYVRVRVDGRTYLLEAPPEIDRRRRHETAVVVDRVTVRPDAATRIAGSVETALSLGKGVLMAAEARPDEPEEQWPLETHSRQCACPKCGRSFEPLQPHHFSFNTPLGWCPGCEGLGVQRGADPRTLVRNPSATLAQGALIPWPAPSLPLAQRMLSTWCSAVGVPMDVPFEQLGSVHRRMIFHGTGDRWFEVHDSEQLPSGPLRFQYKGIYSALEEGGRLSVLLRAATRSLVAEAECTLCGGSRLRSDAASVRFEGRTIDEYTRMPLGRFLDVWRSFALTERQRQIAGESLREIIDRTQFLVDVGLEYLSLARPAPTLSGGEMQRIRLAAQIGSGLCGVLYVLDEPTVGLHPRDNARLIAALKRLRDLGNTLLLVEHDREVIAAADHVLDFGPGAGRLGGQIVARGKPDELGGQDDSITGPYLNRRKAIPVPSNRRPVRGEKGGVQWLSVLGAEHNNLKRIDARFPLGRLIVVTGPSGSGKSSLVDDVLYAAAARRLHRAETFPGKHAAIAGWKHINKVIRVDQQPLGQTPASNAATFTGVFDLIRTLYAELPESRLRGYSARRFSFNIPGGRCEKCEGNGRLCIEMHFLPDVWVECDACNGRRYMPEMLAITYRGKSIADVLEMSCAEALRHFENFPRIRRILQMLCDVGLDYLPLGQSAATLSGGEAQRVKLAAELARPDTGRTLYLLDEPTTGLHFDDLAKLLEVLHRLVDLGNTVIVVEHNLDVIKSADWVIDLGPEAGEAGGRIVFEGTPEELAAYARAERKQATSRKKARTPTDAEAAGATIPQGDGNTGNAASPTTVERRAAQPGSQLRPTQEVVRLRSYTGEALAPVLEAGPYAPRKAFDPNRYDAPRPGDLEVEDVGRSVELPWKADGRRWHLVEHRSRGGQPCVWDARALKVVIDRLAEHSDLFAPPDWEMPYAVEVCSAQRSDVWFCRALTGDRWLLKLRFRTARGTFRRDELVERLNLRPLNEIDELPIYGIESRTRVRNSQRLWQEIELRVYSFAEIDRPEFWRFIDEAVEGFRRIGQRREESPATVEPWKQLGRKWHLARRGFPLGRRVQWPPEVLEQLIDNLTLAAKDGRTTWEDKASVRIHLPGRAAPWAVVYTKRVDAVHLHLKGPKGIATLGRLSELKCRSELEQAPAEDTLRFELREVAEVNDPQLILLIKSHADATRNHN